MSGIFGRESTEVFLCQIVDTGVGGGTLSMRMHAKHIFFTMQSPHATMSIISGNVEDFKTIRRAMKKAEKIYAEKIKEEKTERISRTQADRKLAEVRGKETTATDGRGNKESKRNSKKSGTKKTSKK